MLLSNLSRSEFTGDNHMQGGCPDTSLSTVLWSFVIPGRVDIDEGIAVNLNAEGLDTMFDLLLLKIYNLSSPT